MAENSPSVHCDDNEDEFKEKKIDSGSSENKTKGELKNRIIERKSYLFSSEEDSAVTSFDDSISIRKTFNFSNSDNYENNASSSDIVKQPNDLQKFNIFSLQPKMSCDDLTPDFANANGNNLDDLQLKHSVNDNILSNKIKKESGISETNAMTEMNLATNYFVSKEALEINPFAAWRGFNKSKNNRDPFNLLQTCIYEDYSDTILKSECQKTEHSLIIENKDEKYPKIQAADSRQIIDSSALDMQKPLPGVDYFFQPLNSYENLGISEQVNFLQNCCSGTDSAFDEYKENLNAVTFTCSGNMDETKEETRISNRTTENKRNFCNEESDDSGEFKNGEDKNSEIKMTDVEQETDCKTSEIQKALPSVDYFSRHQYLNENIRKSDQTLSFQKFPSDVNSNFHSYKGNLDSSDLKFRSSMDQTKEEIQGTKRRATSKYNFTERDFDDLTEDSGSFNTFDEDEYNNRIILKAKRIFPKERNYEMPSFHDFGKFNLPSSDVTSVKLPKPKIGEENIFSNNTFKEDNVNEVKCGSIMAEKEEKCVENVNISSNNYAVEKTKQAFNIEYHGHIGDKSIQNSKFSEEFVFAKENTLSGTSSDENIINHSFNPICSLRTGDETEYRADLKTDNTNDSSFNIATRKTHNSASSISSSCATDFTEKFSPERKRLKLFPLSNENLSMNRRLLQIPSEFNSTQQIYTRGLNYSKPFPHSLSFLPFPLRLQISYFFPSENSHM